MDFNPRLSALAIGAVLTASGSVLAGFSGAMFQAATDPAGWAGSSLVASMNSQAAGFNYNPTSGFSAIFSSFELDRTTVQSDVYRMTQVQSIVNGPNTIVLNPGDMVFAYRVRLVNNFPGLTVETLNQAQVIGAPDFGFGQDVMQASLLNGQGFVSNAHGNNPVNGNIDDAAEFGSSVDFQWNLSSDLDQLDNGEEIIMMLFTDPAGVGQGVLNLFSPPGQVGGLTGDAQAGEAPPVLIPIVPTPGAAFLGVLGMGVMLVSRRRNR